MTSKRQKLSAAVCLTALGLLLAATGCKRAEVRIETVPDGADIASLATDRAAYKPGERVRFTARLQETAPSGKLVVRYKHLNETIGEDSISVKSGRAEWEWTPPTADYRGYLAEVLLSQDGKWTDRATMAVDVSSHWAKYPRYGYLADFHQMQEAELEKTVERLNRFHINGVQFYDWQYKHHQPIKWQGDRPAAVWPDIAGREVAYETVRRYIDRLHERGMQAMNYNLLFGAYANAQQDGVKPEWGLFKDPLGQNQDRHPLPDSWESDIYLYNPANPDWQKYLFTAEQKTFETLPFDGWHVDQLGDRGALWDSTGESVRLAQTYPGFLANAAAALGKQLVMNAVGQYGQPLIAQTPVQFLYSEVWEAYPEYRGLKQVIDENNRYGKGKLATVLAAYMDYKHADAKGEFNPPGVLLTDATIFASGASHLEVGENLLAKEYFPNRNLSIPAELESQLIVYYDFLVAYENLLRDPGEEQQLEVTAGGGLSVSSSPQKGKIWALAKEQTGRMVLQLVNYTDAVKMNWNDTDATQAEPALRKDVELSVTEPAGRKVKAIWTATPDALGGAPVSLTFKREGGKLVFTVPQLKYWDMIVLDYEGD
jgi:dextranase